jgi:methylglutaconyl-CoA hydratase
MSEPTSLTVANGVATITLDLPERRNSFGQALLRSLLAHLDAAVTDATVRVMVLTNTGNTFSAGADLKEDRNALGPDAPTFFDVIDRIDASPKPVVARVNGHAAGGGAALAIACDIAVAVDTARIGITEVRLGIAPLPVAAVLVHRLTPRALTESFLTGEMLDAGRAAELGMVNAAVPEAELDATVARYVDALVRSGPEALRVTKRALAEMVLRPADQAAEVAERHDGDDAVDVERREGVAAFVEKRAPQWIPEGWGQAPGQ